MKVRIVTAILVTILGAGVLTACGDGGTSQPNPKPGHAAAAPKAAQKEDNSFIQGVVDDTWNETSPADREDLCLGVSIFTPKELAAMMESGAGDDAPIIDWNVAAKLLSEKCD